MPKRVVRNQVTSSLYEDAVRYTEYVRHPVANQNIGYAVVAKPDD